MARRMKAAKDWGWTPAATGPGMLLSKVLISAQYARVDYELTSVCSGRRRRSRGLLVHSAEEGARDAFEISNY